MSVIRSTPLGAALGAVLIVAAALVAIGVSGRFEVFSANRGRLQLLVAVPLACLAVAGALAYSRLLTRAQMLWAMAPVAVLILAGAGVFGLELWVWPWVLALGAVLFVPWVVGVLLGSALRRERS